MTTKARKVLIVEDLLDFRKILKRYVKHMGFEEVLDTNDGIPALDLILKALMDNEPFDLVLADICMPGMTGLDLLRMIRSDPLTSSLKVILLTSEAEEDKVREAIMLKVDDYLVKPFSPIQLAEKIRRLGLIE